MIVTNNTPWEQYEGIWVKREDLCCVSPGPSFSKIRGVEKHLLSLMKGPFKKTAIGVVDSRHSKAGWGVAYLCAHYLIPCVVYYPVLKSDNGKIRTYQKRCLDFGAEICPLPATKSAVLFYQARKDFYNNNPNGYMMPNGLKLRESISGTAWEVTHHTPMELLNGNKVWVISISSGTIGAGVLQGLRQLDFAGRVILHFGYDRSEKGLKDYLMNMIHLDYNYIPYELIFVNEGYAYKDAVSDSCPFPCNPFYDRKAWRWINQQKDYNKSDIVFWNIGD